MGAGKREVPLVFVPGRGCSSAASVGTCKSSEIPRAFYERISKAAFFAAIEMHEGI